MDVWTRKQKSRRHREAGRRQLRKHCEEAKSLKETGELSREINTGWWERLECKDKEVGLYTFNNGTIEGIC